MSLILGLDVSTSCTGWCVVNREGTLVDIGSIPLSKQKSVYKKAQEVSNILCDIMISHDISNVYIEENLQSFRRGFSSAQTLSTLARFNGIVSLLSYQQFNIEPIHINVNAARKCLGIKIVTKKKGGAPTKEQIVAWASSELGPDYTWPTKVLKNGPRKGQEILDPVAFDMADAYVIARAGFILGSP